MSVSEASSETELQQNVAPPSTNFIHANQLLLKKANRLVTEFQNFCRLNDYVVHSTLLEERDRCFSQFHKTIEVIEENNFKIPVAHITDIDQISSQFSTMYANLRVVTDNPASTSSSYSASNLLTPKFCLPKFNGKLDSWPYFRSIYDNSVHHASNFTLQEKFHLLATHLEGYALDLIKSIPLSADNYHTAYELLVNRYENKRTIANSLYSKLQGFVPDQDISSTLAKFNANLRSIQVSFANLSIDTADFLLYQIAVKTLPNSIRLDYEKSLSASAIPSVNDLLIFTNSLEQSNEALEFSDRTSRNSSPVNVPATFSNVPIKSELTNNSCIVCKKLHPLFRCDAFAALSISHKYNILRETKKCFACLGSHPRSSCNSKNACRLCGDKSHHSVLCKKQSNNVKSLNVLSQPRHVYSSNRQPPHQFSDSIPAVDRRAPFQPQPSNQVFQNQVVTPPGNSSASTSPVNYQPVPYSSPSTSFTSSSSVPQPVPFQVESTPVTSQSFSAHASINEYSASALLGTAVIHIPDAYGNLVPVRAILDSGSQRSIITKKCADKLSLTIHGSNAQLAGVSSNPCKVLGFVNLFVYSRPEYNVRFTVSALVIPQISTYLPALALPSSIREKFSHIPLADECFDQPGEIEFLLGNDLYYHTLVTRGDFLIPGHPSAIKTVFNYVISGNISQQVMPNKQAVQLVSSFFSQSENLNSLVEKFWESEKLPEKHFSKPEDSYCEELYSKTTYRDSTGRYVVQIPLITEAPTLSNNRDVTYCLYLSQEKRLTATPEVFAKYNEFLEEYRILDHMEPAQSQSGYLIPHHCVFKRSDPQGKIRVVFNGSAKKSDEKSLNDFQLSGPKLQKDITEIITSFRTYKYAVCSDTTKMYRQVIVAPQHRKFQHILWRPRAKGPVKEFELKTVTYGLKSSSWLAIRTLHQLVLDEGQDFPLASNAILNNSYVDDIASGAQSEESAKQLIAQLKCLFSKGGFQLSKWSSNQASLLSEVSESHSDSNNSLFNQSETAQVLGIKYNSSTDSFFYDVVEFSGIATKRTILSYIAKTYDPLGLLSPVIFLLKKFMRNLWVAFLEWDQKLTGQLSSQWQELANEMTVLRQICIPRLLALSTSTIRLLGFCDASMDGFAAALYIHSTNEDSKITMNLVASKTRVAPLKLVTIPRLELCGALLLSKLYKAFLPALREYNIEEVLLYTDSKTVIDWLHTPVYKLKMYVANRTQQIIDLTHVKMWHHVSSKDNPADFCSRGLRPSDLVKTASWLNGPDAFQVVRSDFPFSNHKVSTSVPEMRPVKPQEVIASITTDSNDIVSHMEKFSSLQRLHRVMSYTIKFIVALCRRTNRKFENPVLSHWTSRVKPHTSTFPSSEEVNLAKLVCVNLIQERYFHEEISQLNRHKSCNSLKTLSPFLDEYHIIRAGGRIENSPLSYKEKHPTVIPKKCHYARLIVKHYHLLSLHSGPNTTFSLIVKEFWILKARSLVRSVIHHCLTCQRFRPRPAQPIMAHLPADRVNPSRPFSVIGVDFGGPFNYRPCGIRSNKVCKGYLCLIVCFSTKAIHLEFVTSLHTQSFLLAFQRFIARRGAPHTVYSDNATTFKSAAKELRQMHRVVNTPNQDLCAFLSSQSITWKYIPVRSPSFGGLWEAGIKSAKSHLKRIMGKSILNFEEYATMFARIEAVLNSRPLTPLSSSPDESNVFLTPAHFLVGTSLLATPEETIDESMSATQRWTRLKQMSQCFWKRWSRYYLNTLMQKNKWNKATRNLNVNDLVIIKNELTSPLNWPIGVITAVHPGQDNVIRVVSVKTANGVIQRAASKLHLLL